MPKLKKLKYKQHGGVKVTIRQADGSYLATVVDLDIILAIFQNCMDMYLISASSASGTVFGATLPQPVGPAPGVAPIILRSNQINEDGSFRSQDEVADRERYKHKGMIILECGLKISFILRPLSDRADVEVATYSKRVCIERDLEREADVQSVIFRSTLCGTSAPLTFTPDKIAATTMTAVNFSAIVEALAKRALGQSADPRVARALTILREIGTNAKARRLDIHIFVMELLKGETLRTILEKNVVLVSPQEKIAACNNVAIAVIMTFLKSLYWSRDQHADNAMISGANTFTLDFGLMYHLVRDEVRVKSLLSSLITSPTIDIRVVCRYFGIDCTGMFPDDARAEVRRIFNVLYDMLRDPDLKNQMLINTAAADRAAEINRISEIVFQMLSFFALVDGLSNRYKHGTFYFQSSEYMELVFTEPALRSFEDFLHKCRINLSTFVALGTSGNTEGNMAYIVQGLQPALVLCPISGPARTADEIALSAPLSPGLILHNQREADALALAHEEEAARLASERKAHEAELKTKQSERILSRLLRQKTPNSRASPYGDPLSKNTHGGTVKRRFRLQKRQKQTMRPCNIRRQRRTHAIRRRRNKNKTH